MPSIDVVIESELSRSMRVRQLEAMFDVPAAEKMRLEWKGDLPIEDQPWQIGLIVGPSGCGKSTLLNRVFGVPHQFTWDGKAVIDDFPAERPMPEIAEICQAVGFNTIPAWMRPYGVLSNGEKFRVDLARRLLCGEQVITVDEFTSVVDRQVGKIGSHAVQKYVRKHGQRFVAATCHYDVIDWLQPDWILEPATMSFQRRSLRRRPDLNVSICRVPHETWNLFAPFHYMSAALHQNAKCYALYVDNQIAALAAMLHQVHHIARDIMSCSRLVTLPDWQGLGLAMALIDTVGAAFKAIGKRVHTHPAHPALIRTFDRSKAWKLVKKPGFSASPGRLNNSIIGARQSATFCYAGQPLDKTEATRLLALG